MLLSLCIPTHDGRGWSVKELIESIIEQITPEMLGIVEICVSDNGSTDETEELLRRYDARHPGLFRIHRFPQNVGGRLNMLKAVELARGEYVWMLGSDDILEPDAIFTVMREVKRLPDVAGFCFDRNRYDKFLTAIIEDYPHHHPQDAENYHVYTDPDTIVAELGIQQNYLSWIVVKRAYWEEVIESVGAAKVTSYRHFTHSFVHAKITVLHPKWAWVPAKIVKYRSDNDTYLTTPTHQPRFIAEINYDMHRQFRDTIGSSSRGYRATMTKMFELWWSPDQLTQWKLTPGFTNADDLYLLFAFTSSGGFLPIFWKRAFPMLVVPYQLYRLRYNVALGKHVRRVTTVIAPRTRLRAFLRLLGVQNGWTKRYDSHVERARQLAPNDRVAMSAMKSSTDRASINSGDEACR